MSTHRVHTITAFCVVLVVGLLHVIAGETVQTEPTTLPLISIGQPVQPETEGWWVEADGLVTFVGKYGNGMSLELSSGAGHMQVTVAEADDNLAGLLFKSRVRLKGLCIGVYSSVSGEIVSSLSVPGKNEITILQAPQETWQQFPLRTVADLNGATQTNADGRVVHLRGQFLGTNTDGTINLEDKTGELKIHSAQPLPLLAGTEVEVLGIVEREGSSNIVFSEVFRAIGQGQNAASALPVLTTTEQVRWLKPEEANRRYPVKVRAVVTFLLGPSDESAGNLQDGAGGIYAWHLVSSDPDAPVRPGDFCEIEGETSAGEFSPGIDCRKLKVLGRGEFPEPVRPTWDELASGSLDAQWVEVEGMVLSAMDQHLEIATQGGRISCFVAAGENLGRFLNAIVQVRGVVVANRDQARHVQGVHLNLPAEQFISLETPPLADPFSLPARHIKGLLIYDPGEPAFRREKVLGQIAGVRDGVGYLTDGTNGLRLNLKENAKLAAGDTVEAAGFPVIDNVTEPPLLALREAVVRVTGRKPLPPAVKIAPVNLLESEHDSTLVQLEAQLIHMGVYGADQVLELQAGARTFFARLNASAGTIPQLPAGSRVELTGVYVFNNGKSNGRIEAGPFELLLNSPADVQVLALPSWWTSEHALTVVSGMAVLILLGLVWIGLLRQQVGRRTAQLSTANKSLEAEITERKRTENELVRTRLQHLIEQERTRIARDIHDELGSSLSQIRLLSEMTLSQNVAPSEIQSNSGKISAKALEATHVLDEIVWAVDPHNDTLESLLNYLFSFASHYLSLAGIRFRIDAPTQMPQHVLTTQVRHQLYMAVKETLTNIVNHAHATEVWIRVQLEAGMVCFVIEDNGRGLDLSGRAEGFPGASGLNNMRKRFSEINGSFVLESAPNRGTRAKFVLPLTEKRRP